MAFSQIRYKLRIGLERASLLIALVRAHQSKSDFTVRPQEHDILMAGFLQQAIDIETFDW
jgi:hypothetical protein